MAILKLISLLLPSFIVLAKQAVFVHGALYSFPDCVKGPLKDNGVCDTTLDPAARAKALVSLFTIEELTNNTVDAAPGVPRLGLEPYEWWSEALHGVAGSPGVKFAAFGEPFGHATSFPQPILLGATFDDKLIKDVANVISTEARAYNNAGRAGLDYFTPNINPFKDPRWGRGQETPGEDPYHISRYVYQLIDGLQGGIGPQPYYKTIADCKHFAAYDMEEWKGQPRYGFDAVVSRQELSEYYFPPFQSCVRDAKVASVMCAYNAVNGVPSCANPWLLQTVLREHWGFGETGGWVTSDCDAVHNVFADHHYTEDYVHAAAVSLKAGTDVNCGWPGPFTLNLPEAYNKSLVTRENLETAVTRLYSTLIKAGYFDPPEDQPYRQLGWDAVDTQNARDLAYKSAVEGFVLLKNDGTLPLKAGVKKVALVGPWANVTTLMLGNYYGVPPFFSTPYFGALNAGYDVALEMGTTVSGNDSTHFDAAIEAAQGSDVIVFTGGLDQNIEREERDRLNVTWPGLQLQLINKLQELGKPLIVVDSTVLKESNKVNAILWGGYPGQSGGDALFDIITGKVAPAGRLPTTQYPAAYSDLVEMTDMSVRPKGKNPGRTYMWYTGQAVFPFGHGLHYTTFGFSWVKGPAARYDIANIVQPEAGVKFLDLKAFATFEVAVENTGDTTSDYVALLFLAGQDTGPSPQPIKRLVSYTRLSSIQPGQKTVGALEITLGSIARADEEGDFWIYPGKYRLQLDTVDPVALYQEFELVGEAARVAILPKNTV
ncbi:glycoside hydrolase family 3 protein [Ephemerocybe angulata]|uniref:xylan 1,4-beta-xylosidase n=1 Tax=Ephemerocybe angulata TaxID=980116 RepID=A0A8H6IC99_9AGAR|nr:glycoside hydrolase family 3 protein [Tulosesus angulatus]